CFNALNILTHAHDNLICSIYHFSHFFRRNFSIGENASKYPVNHVEFHSPKGIGTLSKVQRKIPVPPVERITNLGGFVTKTGLKPCHLACMVIWKLVS